MKNFNVANVVFNKTTRNDLLVDIIKKAKNNIDKNEELIDVMMVVLTSEGKVLLFGQSLLDVSPVEALGLLELAKIKLLAQIES